MAPTSNTDSNASIDCGNTGKNIGVAPQRVSPRPVLSQTAPGFEQATSYELPSPSPASDYTSAADSFVSGPRSKTSPPYTCSRCSKSYDKQHELNKHYKSHLRDFKCGFTEFESCERGFGFRRDLQRHMQSKHPQQHINNSALFPCDREGCEWAATGSKAGFLRRDALYRHLRRHDKRR